MSIKNLLLCLMSVVFIIIMVDIYRHGQIGLVGFVLGFVLFGLHLILQKSTLQKEPLKIKQISKSDIKYILIFGPIYVALLVLNEFYIKPSLVPKLKKIEIIGLYGDRLASLAGIIFFSIIFVNYIKLNLTNDRKL